MGVSIGQEHFPVKLPTKKMGSVPAADTGVTRENLYQQERTRCSTQFPGSNDLLVHGGKYPLSICLWEGRRGPVERLEAIRLLRTLLNGLERLAGLSGASIPYQSFNRAGRFATVALCHTPLRAAVI